MDWSLLFNFLGAGGGLVVLLSWIGDIPKRRWERKRDRETTYRQLLDGDMVQMSELMDLYKTLQDDSIRIQNRVSALEGAVLLVESCPYYRRCPARRVVQDYKAHYHAARTGQPLVEQRGHRHPRDNPVKQGDAGHPDGEPP